MKFIEAETMLALLFCKLINSKIGKINTSQIFAFRFKIIEIYSKKVGANHKNARRLVLTISDKEIRDFTDEYKKYLSCNFLTQNITILDDMKDEFVNCINEKFKNHISDFDNCLEESINEAISSVFTTE